MKNITLNTGVTIPVIGSGTNTFGKVDRDYMGAINDDTSEIEAAIKAGYRHFDTAISYRNESVVALGIERSGLNRSEFFITSKIPGKEAYYETQEAVHKGVKQSLEALNTDYIDLYLIHHPWDDMEGMLQMWAVLESYVDLGVLKSIGVSNFTQEQLTTLIQRARIKPAVNQIESHPGKWNGELTAFCLEHGIGVEAWGPLSRTSQESKDALEAIGQKYHKTWAQVALRYQIQRGVIVIPKSHNALRQALNLELFDFELSPQEMNAIATL
ncbi:aldo/keto reductase [Erysipelothrix larvae]|uniref:Aldo/keto reductase n=1 Tax=Erysipelothrix larvae TaxID=1514105 RepID=A0A120JTR8_9FIRM|nr:aldo/keto reductase [Erysipelothrix larvae]AMC93738.1 aldo/keto reductase [Erysipelothrix larvae]